MNENQKTILNLVLCFLLGVAVTLSVTIPIFISSARRADIKSQQLSDRLSENDRRLTAVSDIISQCRESTERISEIAERGNGTLTGVIESLRQIRDEVKVMEERLYNFDNSSGDNDRNNNSSVVLSE